MPAPTPDDIKGYALQLLRGGSSPQEVHDAVRDRFRDRPAEQIPSERTIVNWKTEDRKQQKEALAAGAPLAPQTLPPRAPLPLAADGDVDVARAYTQRIKHDLRLAAAVHEVLVAWVERVSRSDKQLTGTELQQLTGILANTRTSTATYLKAEEEKEPVDPLDDLLSQLTKDQLKRLVAGESIPIEEQPA